MALPVEEADVLVLCPKTALEDLAVSGEAGQPSARWLDEPVAHLQLRTSFSPRQDGFLETLVFLVSDMIYLGKRHHPTLTPSPTVFILWRDPSKPPSCPQHISELSYGACSWPAPPCHPAGHHRSALWVPFQGGGYSNSLSSYFSLNFLSIFHF